MKVMNLNTLALAAALLLPGAHAQGVSWTPVEAVRVVAPRTALIPTPQRAEFPAGTLPLTGLGVRVVGNAPELGWAARDLKAEWQTRLGLELPNQAAASGPAITLGTTADPELAARMRAAGLEARGEEGYALLVDAQGAAVVGATPLGAYRGAQTLRQLLTPTGLRFARISDFPGLRERVAMIYLDANSKGVNDRLIPLLAALKFNAVLVMSNYVQWDAAKAGGYAHPGGATKAEARRVADLAREYGLEVIPLIETLSHTGWMFYGGKNADLKQDPDSQNPWAYDTLNPTTYDRVILPVLKEAVELFQPTRLHLGHDEVRNRDRFPARESGKAVGFEKLFVDDVVKLHGFLKSLNVGSMIWHDTAFADAVVGTLPPQLPKDLQVAYWKYTPGQDKALLGKIKTWGFPLLGATWNGAQNQVEMARTIQAQGGAGAIQTRWTGYFGNPSLWDGQADQAPPFVLAAGAFWNPAAPEVQAPGEVFRDLYAPQRYALSPGSAADLSPLVTRSLADPDGKGWILKGPDIDLGAVPTGLVRLGAYTFDVRGAVMLRGSRAAARDLPERAVIEVGRRVRTLAFLHTTAWPAAVNRERIGSYEIEYADGSKLTQPIEYGRHIRAWTDTLPTSLIPLPGWAGKTRDGLDVALSVLEWANPKPDVEVRRVTLVSAGGNANPVLIGLSATQAP